MTALDDHGSSETVYSTVVESDGDGRSGRIRSSDGRLELALSTPGASRPGTNPEQLFAGGYAACFHSALRAAARERRVDVGTSTVSAAVDLVKDSGGFRLDVELRVRVDIDNDVDDVVARELALDAHARCPYSKAIAASVSVRVQVNNEHVTG